MYQKRAENLRQRTAVRGTEGTRTISSEAILKRIKQIKKHGTVPPADFGKWAQICEHIILHYNFGWANGYHLNIRYWEIWNEPDLDADDSPNKRTWGGTKARFFDLYELAAKHLKTRFPELMIGGTCACA